MFDVSTKYEYVKVNSIINFRMTNTVRTWSVQEVDPTELWTGCSATRVIVGTTDPAPTLAMNGRIFRIATGTVGIAPFSTLTNNHREITTVRSTHSILNIC